jgi:hypothetical protein
LNLLKSHDREDVREGTRMQVPKRTNTPYKTKTQRVGWTRVLSPRDICRLAVLTLGRYRFVAITRSD